MTGCASTVSENTSLKKRRHMLPFFLLFRFRKKRGRNHACASSFLYMLATGKDSHDDDCGAVNDGRGLDCSEYSPGRRVRAGDGMLAASRVCVWHGDELMTLMMIGLLDHGRMRARSKQQDLLRGRSEQG